MNTFFSIVYATIRPLLGERLSVGLFMSDGANIRFRYSKAKLDVLGKLLPKEAYQLMKANLKSINGYIEEQQNNPFYENIPDRFIDESYFQYLSKYSNNLISFSEPKKIEYELNELNFNSLFAKYVQANEKEIGSSKKDVVDILRRRVDPKIESHVNLDAELNCNHIKTLTISTRVWFIGQNEVKVTGEAVDFNKQHHFVLNDLRSYLYLIDRMEHAGLNRAKHFLVGEEPAKNNFTNHNLWKEIIKSKELEYLDISDSEKITEYITTHKVSPFVLM